MINHHSGFVNKQENNITEASIISKVWNFAGVLRDDGVSYGDYLEHLFAGFKNGRRTKV